MRIIDEINTLSEDEILDIGSYFDEMELSEIEKEERKKFANEVDEMMIFIFALFLTMQEFNRMDKSYIINRLEERYSEIVLQYIAIDKLLGEYIKRFSEEIVNTTVKYSDESYYTSNNRAAIVAVNESNSILGYRQLQEAKENGYAYKEWITERDNKVRKTHRAVDGERILIDEYFLVGDSYMQYPHDIQADPEEIIGCRCTLKFS